MTRHWVASSASEEENVDFSWNGGCRVVRLRITDDDRGLMGSGSVQLPRLRIELSSRGCESLSKDDDNEEEGEVV